MIYLYLYINYIIYKHILYVNINIYHNVKESSTVLENLKKYSQFFYSCTYVINILSRWTNIKLRSL